MWVVAKLLWAIHQPRLASQIARGWPELMSFSVPQRITLSVITASVRSCKFQNDWGKVQIEICILRKPILRPYEANEKLSWCLCLHRPNDGLVFCTQAVLLVTYVTLLA